MHTIELKFAPKPPPRTDIAVGDIVIRAAGNNVGEGVVSETGSHMFVVRLRDGLIMDKFLLSGGSKEERASFVHTQLSRVGFYKPDPGTVITIKF